MPLLLPHQVTVAGWGLLEDGGRAATRLQEVNLEVTALLGSLIQRSSSLLCKAQLIQSQFWQILWMNQCREDFKYQRWWITSRMLCTYRPDQDACQGDSGGPLVRLNAESGRYEQVGRC